MESHVGIEPTPSVWKTEILAVIRMEHGVRYGNWTRLSALARRHISHYANPTLVSYIGFEPMTSWSQIRHSGQAELIGDLAPRQGFAPWPHGFGDRYAAVTPPGYWSAGWDSNPQTTVFKTARFTGFLHLPIWWARMDLHHRCILRSRFTVCRLRYWPTDSFGACLRCRSPYLLQYSLFSGQVCEPSQLNRHFYWRFRWDLDSRSGSCSPLPSLLATESSMVDLLCYAHSSPALQAGAFTRLA